VIGSSFEEDGEMTMLQVAVAERAELVPLDVDQYHRMLEAGILREAEPVELLDGLLVRKDRGGESMTVKPLHASTLSRLLAIVSSLSGCHLRIQDPITVRPSHEPEPDAAIVRGRPQDYSERHPEPDDVVSVIEISESSLEHDRKTKLRIYAAAGIAQYVIVNLVDGRVEVYEDPDPDAESFRKVRLLTVDDRIELRISPDGDRLAIPASDWLT
jgi:Uma2 family endonuclease